jgi:hypothetical protein
MHADSSVDKMHVVVRGPKERRVQVGVSETPGNFVSALGLVLFPEHYVGGNLRHGSLIVVRAAAHQSALVFAQGAGKHGERVDIEEIELGHELRSSPGCSR